ncbi:MAG: IclR family transcriptional regulator, partial [bacterium]
MTASVRGPKVLDKALRVLDLFTVERPAWSASEMARELKLPTATAHRILRGLEYRDYLMRSGSMYRLGLAAMDLGYRATASVDLRWRLRSTLQDLAVQTQETTLLTVTQEGSGSLCIDRIETRQSLRLSIEIGRVTPIHAGASAKALLAFSDPLLIEEALGQRLERLASGTITDPKRLRVELEKIRKAGWAYSYEENNDGAWGLAAPILFNERVVASVGLAAPTARHSEE